MMTRRRRHDNKEHDTTTRRQRPRHVSVTTTTRPKTHRQNADNTTRCPRGPFPSFLPPAPPHPTHLPSLPQPTPPLHTHPPPPPPSSVEFVCSHETTAQCCDSSFSISVAQLVVSVLINTLTSHAGLESYQSQTHLPSQRAQHTRDTYLTLHPPLPSSSLPTPHTQTTLHTHSKQTITHPQRPTRNVATKLCLDAKAQLNEAQRQSHRGSHQHCNGPLRPKRQPCLRRPLQNRA